MLCRAEGRTWYTAHRGRLWIAAAAKRPSPQEIAQVEAMYRQIFKQGVLWHGADLLGFQSNGVHFVNGHTRVTEAQTRPVRSTSSELKLHNVQIGLS